jgi:hypothetical protein
MKVEGEKIRSKEGVVKEKRNGNREEVSKRERK